VVHHIFTSINFIIIIFINIFIIIACCLDPRYCTSMLRRRGVSIKERLKARDALFRTGGYMIEPLLTNQ